MIGAVGAMAGALGASTAAAGAIGAIVGGAIVGAASGAVIQMGNNIIDGKNLMAGVGEAALVGAIGGALGGAGGALGQVLGQAGKLGAGMTQSLLKFGIETGFDTVGNILGDLASGHPITFESVLTSTLQGIGMSLAMSRVGKIKAVEATQTKFSDLGGELGNVAGTRIKSGLSGDIDIPTSTHTNVDTPSVKQTEVEVKPSEADAKLPTSEVNNKLSNHFNEPEVEPGIVAKQTTTDGHDIKVLKDGRIVRCSDCGELRNRYSEELQDLNLKNRLEEIEAIPDPKQKATQAQHLESELAKIKELRQSNQTRLTESKKRFSNFRKIVDPKEIQGAPDFAGSGVSGHAKSKHGISNQTQAEILNNPERIFSGINSNGREVDIYYKDGTVVITQASNKSSVITAYGKADTKGKSPKPVNPDKWTNDTNYVEIKVKGANEVIYPSREAWDGNNWPPI